MTEQRAAFISALIIALGPISLALYTPIMPELVAVFATTTGAVKLTISLYFLGFAFAQLVCGPLSDAFGRRPVAIVFFTIYLAASVAAALAPTIEFLQVARCLQGIGAAAGVATSRALVRDLFIGQASARIMNLTGLMVGIAPAIAPTLGSLAAAVWSWHAVFALMIFYGVVVVASVLLILPETNAFKDRSLIRPRLLFGNYATLLTSRSFMAPALVMGLTLGGLYTMPALLPFVLIDRIGLTPVQYGLLMAFQTAAYLSGNVLTGRLLRRFDAHRLVPLGLGLVLFAAVMYALLLALFPVRLLTIITPSIIWVFAIAMITPGTMTSALSGFPRVAGSAAALLGFFQIGGGLAGTTASALFFSDPLTALTVVLPAMALLAAAMYVLLWR
ncbi:MAG: multidrug effflux MFS transporter [Hyphomicrobiaceae bacterium]